MNKKVIGISLIVILLDQLIKWIVDWKMYIGKSISIIPNFFRLTYVQNDGAAWSILSGNRILFIIIAIFSIIAIYVFFIHHKKINKLETISFSLLLGGIIGNVIDRIVHGAVIDYLDFTIFGYDFPIFNLADSCIVIAVILLAIIIIRGEKHE